MTTHVQEGASATAHVRYKNNADAYVDGQTFSIAEGQTATFPIAANADPQLGVAWTLTEGAEIETWLDNGSELTSLTGTSGTIVNRWSNPATLITNDPATYSCIIGEAPEPETGSSKLLCGKYGTLLYAGNPTTKSQPSC